MVVKMLWTVTFPGLPEIIAFANASLQAEVYLLNGYGEGIWDVASPCRLLEIASVPYPAGVISKQ
jgi:hypothetical protein